MRTVVARPAPSVVSHIPRAPVRSSALATVGYSKRLHILEVEFLNGAVYRYLDVPAFVHQQLLAAESKARYYDQNIRYRFVSQRVRPRESTERT
jgi:hypothetical protein